MRVTDRMRYQDFVPRYQQLSARQIALQRMIAGGKRILRASDDPAAAGQSNILESNIAGLEQNLRNMDEARAWTNATETGINTAIEVMQRANELVIRAGDPSLRATDRADIAAEIEQILKTVVGLGDQKYRGQTLYSGTRTTTGGFTTTLNAQGKIATVTYQGNAELKNVEIAPGRTSDYNMLGQSDGVTSNYGLLRDTGDGTDIFQTLIDFRTYLENNDVTNITGQSVGKINASITHLTKGMAKLGGIQTRFDDTLTVNEDHQQTIIESLSKLIETDIAEASVEFASVQNSYQAALSMGARVMELSLVNFIR